MQPSPQMFSGVVAKINRALKHLDDLETETVGWEQLRPYSFRVDPEGQASQHTIYVRFTKKPDAETWGLIFGDVMHCLRSALDHLVYGLAIVASGQDPPPKWSRLEFPIFLNANDWQNAKPKLTSLTPAMRTRIKAIQPFEVEPPTRPENTYLWLVHQFDVIDKHRQVVPFGLLANTTVMPKFKAVTSGRATVEVPRVDFTKDEAPLLTVTCPDGSINEMKNEDQGDFDFLPHVVLGNRPFPMLMVAGNAYNHVLDCLMAFSDFTGFTPPLARAAQGASPAVAANPVDVRLSTEKG